MSKALEKHYEWGGKIEVVSRVKVDSSEALSLAYTPGVADACREIVSDPDKDYLLTRRANLVAVITDGTAVLGLGDIGPRAGMPVMEGKCCIFKELGGVDAFPICVNTGDSDEFVSVVSAISCSFGGINLEDIAAPRCFDIEARLKKLCDIPVFHDDQHGTAAVVLAAVINSLRLTGRSRETVRVVINGAGSAGIAIGKMLFAYGITDIVMCDREGVLVPGRNCMNPVQEEMAKKVNPRGVTGLLSDAMRGADIFIGVSAGNTVTQDMVRSMAADPVVFAMANPVPEIMPEDAKKAGARVVGSGRSDCENQINNALMFPGLFRGALDVRASDINDDMLIAAAGAVASLVSDSELREDYVIPKVFDPRVGKAVASAAAEAARRCGIARV